MHLQDGVIDVQGVVLYSGMSDPDSCSCLAGAVILSHSCLSMNANLTHWVGFSRLRLQTHRTRQPLTLVLYTSFNKNSQPVCSDSCNPKLPANTLSSDFKEQWNTVLLLLLLCLLVLKTKVATSFHLCEDPRSVSVEHWFYCFWCYLPCAGAWYGDSAGNTVEENSSVFSLIRMC